MTVFRLVGEDGVPAFHELAPGQDLPDGAVVVGRWPAAGEDFVNGAWSRLPRGPADAEVGHEHIATARNLKYLEALLIMSGMEPVTGLLKLEAAEKGVTLQQLAEDVLARRVEFVRREVQRQRRQSGNDTEYTIPPGDPLAGLT